MAVDRLNRGDVSPFRSNCGGDASENISMRASSELFGEEVLTMKFIHGDEKHIISIGIGDYVDATTRDFSKT